MIDLLKKQYIFLLLCLLSVMICGCHHPCERFPEAHPLAWTPGEVELMLGGEDRLEGFNRSMFACTDFVMSYVADPLGRVYTTIFPRPFIEHFDNVCVNLEYPARAVSALLQAEWGAAGTETVRFLANTTLGIAGIFDVARAWWHIPPAEADFGQAFASWGIGPGNTFMLPFVQAMNGRDIAGALFDTAFDLKTYIPYAGYATFLNRMTVAQNGYSKIVENSFDPYKNYRQFMLVRRELLLRMWFYKEVQRQIAEYRKSQAAGTNQAVPAGKNSVWHPPERPETLAFGNYVGLKNFFPQGSETDTLRVMLARVQRDNDRWYMPLSLFNGDFVRQAYLRKIELAPERPKFRYAFWKAPEKSDKEGKTAENREKMVILLSGIGGTYTNGTLMTLAEQFNNAGYAVLTMDSTFNWHFVVSDGNCKLPGYLPDDAARIRNALKHVIADLRKREWIKSPETVLCGYSMGGIQTLKLAEMEMDSPQLNISKYIAVNPPVALGSALNSIDGLVSQSAGWTKSEMRERLISAGGRIFMKMAPHYRHVTESSPEEAFRKFTIPLDKQSAKVIAGIFLKMSMREMLLAVHREKPLKGFAPYSWGRRDKLYRDLDRVTFADYAKDILAPCYPGRTLDELLEKSSLYSLEKCLRTNPDIRVFHNIDDFLLTQEERVWLDGVLGKRLTWFSNGGHLGNFYYRRVLDMIVDSAER